MTGQPPTPAALSYAARLQREVRRLVEGPGTGEHHDMMRRQAESIVYVDHATYPDVAEARAIERDALGPRVPSRAEREARGIHPRPTISAGLIERHVIALVGEWITHLQDDARVDLTTLTQAEISAYIDRHRREDYR